MGVSSSRRFVPLLAALFVVTTRGVPAQSPADGWSGQIQCVLSVRGTGYQDDQTQTWTVTGAAVPRNDFRDYPATWTVMGSGSRTPADSWTRTGSDATGGLTLFVPVGTSTIRVAPGQRVLKAVGGIHATVASVPVTGDADEWRGFLYFDAAGAATQTAFNGSRTQMRTDLVGFRQPAGASVIETCTWNFARGSIARIAAVSTQQPTLTTQQPTLMTQSGAQAGTATQVTLSSAGSTTIQQVDTTTTAPTATVANAPTLSGAVISPTTSNVLSNTAAILSSGPAPRTITLSGFTASGSSAASSPRTIMLAGFTAAGASAGAAPRTITLSGFTASGSSAAVSPRIITLAGFSAAGASAAAAPRTITLPGFTAAGTAPAVAPRTITLPGWTSAAP